MKTLFTFLTHLLLMLLILFTSGQAQSAIDVYEFETPQQEVQYRTLIDELRCPKCQNQNLASSDSPIAQDLKRKTYELIQQGQTNEQIRSYMQTRYGDFINYKPPVRPATYVLWFLPPILLLMMIGTWVVFNRKKVVTHDAQTSDLDIALNSDEQKQLKQLLTSYEATVQEVKMAEHSLQSQANKKNKDEG